MTLSLFEDAPPPVSPLPVNTDPWKQYGGVTLYLGDNLPILRAMRANSVDAVVTDPPYGIGFMGKEWDTFTPDNLAKERKEFRIGRGTLKDHDNPNLRGRSSTPAISPSQIEYDRTLDGQRGFQAFCLTWALEVYRVLKPGGHMVVCGAPRSAHRMTSGIEDAGFEVRDALAWIFGQGFPKSHNLDGGLGTALKPGYEPIPLFRKPFDVSVQDVVDRWRTGALRIEASRLAPGERVPGGSDPGASRTTANGPDGHSLGRWPPNVAIDEIVAGELDFAAGRPVSRYFFCPKPSRSERDFGCDHLVHRSAGECTDRKDGSAGLTPYAGAGRFSGARNYHPTVKPVALMRWLARLVTPAGGTVLDLFLGSGTTAVACVHEDLAVIGIEKEVDYLTIADARVAATYREVHG